MIVRCYSLTEFFDAIIYFLLAALTQYPLGLICLPVHSEFDVHETVVVVLKCNMFTANSLLKILRSIFAWRTSTASV